MKDQVPMLNILAAQEPGTDRQVLESFLRFVGQKASFAGSADELRTCAEARPYDLILLSTDNQELAGLAQLQAQAELWVGLGNQAGPPFNPPKGWFCYLPKPLDLEAFQDCIRAACRKLGEGSAEEGGQGLLDHALIEARKDIDPQLVVSLIDIFNQDAPVMIDQLNHLIQNRDWAELKVWAHKFKGMTANVGAAAMSRLGRRIEQAAEAAQAEQAAEFSGSLKPMLDQTRAEFEKLIDELKQ